MLRAVPQAPPDSPLLSADDVAAQIGLSPKVTRELLRAGAIPCVTSGETRPHYYVHQAELEDWILRGRPRTATRTVDMAELLTGLRTILDQYQCDVTVRFHKRP